MADEGLIRCCCRLSPGWAGRTGSVRMRCHTSQRGFLPLTETERSPKALGTFFNALPVRHVPDVVSRLAFLASSFGFSSADSLIRYYLFCSRNYVDEVFRPCGLDHQAPWQTPSVITEAYHPVSCSCRKPSIGIGGAVARPPLPHHRAYGSVHGGSAGSASRTFAAENYFE